MRVIDPRRFSINPLKDRGYESACDFVDIIGDLFADSGQGTLMKDTGLDFIGERLAESKRSLANLIPPPEKNSPTGHVWAYGKIGRIMRSPVLRHFLSSKRDDRNHLHENSRSVAVIDRRTLTPFDARAIGLFLISYFKGQIIVEDAGFYLSDFHSALIFQDRLMLGCNHLGELPPKLRKAALLIEDKYPCGALFDDAEELTKMAGYRPVKDKDDCDYNLMIESAMGDGSRWRAGR